VIKSFRHKGLEAFFRRVNGNWHVTFRFVGQDVELDDYLDYY